MGSDTATPSYWDTTECICMLELRTNSNNCHSLSLSQDRNPGPSKYDAGLPVRASDEERKSDICAALAVFL
jgi:hypothetical protein